MSSTRTTNWPATARSSTPCSSSERRVTTAVGARPPSSTEPMFTVGDNVHYYGVDHSPSLLWDSATWEISEALLPHLRTVLTGPAGWDADQIVRGAIEIRDGNIQNPTILTYQHRSPHYPHDTCDE